ncbi:MAG: tetratricopeptide repeat protein [Desulfobacula sp.]|nr:tetratricopeptide repeat protein [Desulfobacula sp.]
MKKFVLLSCALLFIPAFSYAAIIGKVMVPDNLLKWERQKDMDEYFKGKPVLIYSSEGQEVFIDLPDKGFEVKKGAITDTIIQKLKEAHPDRMDDIKTLNFGGRTWYGIGEEDDGAVFYTGFISSGLTIYPVDIAIESPGIIPESIKNFLSKIQIQKFVRDSKAAPLISKGNKYLSQKEYSKAIKVYDQAIEIDPMSPEAYYFRGICHKNMKNYFDARLDLEVAMLMKESADLKQSAEFMVEAADIEMAAQDFDKAESWLSKALKINPEHDGAYQSLGRVYFASGELDKSANAYKKALRLNPFIHGAGTGQKQIQEDKKKNVIAANETKSLESFRKLPPLPPLSTILTTAKASVVVPKLDPADFSKLQYLGAVSAVKKAMEDLIGPMKPEVNTEFQAQWAAIYDYPADECVTYLNKAAPILGEILSLRASMMKVIQSYDNFFNQAQMANFVGNPEASHELMRRAGQSAALLKALERRTGEAVKEFAALGDLPDVEKIKAATAQSYSRSKNLLKALVNPPELSGEYEPALYQTVQDPFYGGSVQDHNSIRTEKDEDYDSITYFQPLKTMGDNLIVMYVCETDNEGDKSSWLELFEKRDDGSFVTYPSEQNKVVYTLTEDGFTKHEYMFSPKNIIDDEEKLFRNIAKQISKGKVPDIELYYSVRSRTFYANHVQYQKPPTDNEFNWKKWEKNLKKHQKLFLEEFQEDRLVFETLAQKLALPEPVPAENIFWVLDRMEQVNENPSQKGRSSIFSGKVDAAYQEMMKRNDGFSPRPMRLGSMTIDISDSEINSIDKQIVFDDSTRDKIVRDSITIKYDLLWGMPTPVIAQAGGNLSFNLNAKRKVSAPNETLLIPSRFTDMTAVLKPGIVDENGKYMGGYAGDSVSLNLLDQYQTSGRRNVSQKSVLKFPIENFSSQAVVIDFHCTFFHDRDLYMYSGAGLKLYYKRKIMTLDEAAALSEQMGEDLELVAQKKQVAKDKKKKNDQAVKQHAKARIGDLKESMDFHAANIKYENLRATKYAQELEKELTALKKMGRSPTQDQQKRIAALRFIIITAQSNVISEQDKIRELKTGTYKRSETPFDTMARIQFRQNIEKNIRRIETLESQEELAEKYIEFLPKADRAQAKKTLQKIRDESPDDIKKFLKLNAALKKKWHGREGAKIAKMDEDLAWKDAQVSAIENIKMGADVGMLACSMMGGPQAIALTYQFATGWAEKDLFNGVKQSVSMYSDAVDIAWSTYDGYCQDGWYGAAKAGGFSLLMNKGLPFLVGKMGKGDVDLPGSKIGKASDSISNAAKKVDVIKPRMAVGKPKSKITISKVDDVKLYKAELETAENQVKGFVTDYHNWKKGIKKGLPEDDIKQLHKKVIASTSAINANPTAKGYLKYKAPKATGRFFDKSLDQIHSKARQQYYKAMKDAGYSDHEIFAIRNAASSGSTGMDFDQALKEQPDYIPFKNKDGSMSMRRNIWLTKNGKPASRHQWQMDAQDAWNDAYKKASNGHSAPKAWENMTSSVDPEAYKQMSMLNIKKDLSNVGEIMDNLDPKWVRQTSDVTLFKAGEMLKDKNLSRLAGVREACRGTAKDLDGKFLPFINTKLSKLKQIDASKLTASDKHNIKRLESALDRFTKVKNGFDAIGKADIPPTQWDDTIKKTTGGKGIMQTIQDLSDLTQSLFM